MRKKGLSALWQKKQYAIAGALVVAAAIGMTALYSSEQAKERENLEKEIARELEEERASNVAWEEEEGTEAEAASSFVKPKENTETEQESTEMAALDGAEEEEGEKEGEEEKPQELALEKPQEELAQAEEPESTKSAGAVTPTLHFEADEGILWPMEGNVIINYSMDSTVYFATLDQYKYNPGVVISGEVNDKVYSVAKGQIASIENDVVTGTTVTVDLGDGYEAVYGQLKELNFNVGDYVEAGHVLGYISEPTKYYSIEGSNLYFELRKDKEPIDPIEFFE